MYEPEKTRESLWTYVHRYPNCSRQNRYKGTTNCLRQHVFTTSSVSRGTSYSFL